LQAREAISSWSALIDYVCREIQRETREQCPIMLLDRKRQLILDEII
jgi:DNA repair protein RadC